MPVNVNMLTIVVVIYYLSTFSLVLLENFLNSRISNFSLRKKGNPGDRKVYTYIYDFFIHLFFGALNFIYHSDRI